MRVTNPTSQSKVLTRQVIHSQLRVDSILNKFAAFIAIILSTSILLPSNFESFYFVQSSAGADSRGAIAAIIPPKRYESNFIHHDFVQFGKQHSRYKAICDVFFISHTVVNP